MNRASNRRPVAARPGVPAGLLVSALALAAVTVSACTAGHGTGPGRGGQPAASRLATPAGVGEVKLIGPAETNAGATPTFRWSVVGGASRYELFVRDGRGLPVWAWQGTGTSVPLGGLSIDRPASAPGPRLVTGSTWMVVAVDGAGKVRAVSDIRPVNP